MCVCAGECVCRCVRAQANEKASDELHERVSEWTCFPKKDLEEV